MKKYNQQEDDGLTKHLELAAGNGVFGKKYFPPCYATDIDAKKQNIDFQCDAEKTNFPDNRFNKIIICNPHGFGFKKEEESLKLLNELTRILTVEGSIIIIGNDKKNVYCKVKNVEKQIAVFNQISKDICLEMSYEGIIPEQAYNGYKFYQSDGVIETVPDVKIVIKLISKNID